MSLPRLQDLSLVKRIVLAAIIVALALLMLFALSKLLGDSAEAQPRSEPLLYQGIPLDAHLLALDKLALEEAYREQLIHLFSIWLKGQAKNTEEITRGVAIARGAYNTVAQQIRRREQQLEAAKQGEAK